MTTTRIERLQATLDSVLLNGPEHFDMADWFGRQDFDGGEIRSYETCEAPHVDINQCGTTACLAGHGALAMWQLERTTAEEAGIAEWLGIDEGLFYIGGYGFSVENPCQSADPTEQWEWAVRLLQDEIKKEEALDG